MAIPWRHVGRIDRRRLEAQRSGVDLTRVEVGQHDLDVIQAAV
jgi:hypothetical protein